MPKTILMEDKMKEKLVEIIKEAGKLLKEGYFSNKEVNFKAKKI